MEKEVTFYEKEKVRRKIYANISYRLSQSGRIKGT